MQFRVLPTFSLLRERQPSIDELQQILEDRRIKKDPIALYRSLQTLEGEGPIRQEYTVARFWSLRMMVPLIAAFRKDFSSHTEGD